MKLLALALASILAPMVVDAAVGFNPIIECSTVDLPGNAPFDACATSFFTSPSPAMYPNGTTVYMGGYSNEYTIATGLKEGADTSTLTKAASKKAFSNGIVVSVARDDNDVCTVTVTVKGKSNACGSCSYCGNDEYSADCSALKNGRNVTCEATGEDDVYFPLTMNALSCSSMKPPLGNVVKAPVVPKEIKKAPTPTGKRTPVKAPIKAPVKVKAPIKAPVKAKAPIKAPVKAKAPIKAPAKVKAPRARAPSN